MIQSDIGLTFSEDLMLLVVSHNLHLRDGFNSIILATSLLLAQKDFPVGPLTNHAQNLKAFKIDCSSGLSATVSSLRLLQVHSRPLFLCGPVLNVGRPSYRLPRWLERPSLLMLSR